MGHYSECVGDLEIPGGTVKSGLPVPDEQFVKNVRHNCLLELPNVEIAKEHDKIMVMVCGGPTAKDHLDEIRAKRADDQYRIFCSNKTHDWLISEGIIPHYQFIIDPKANKVDDVQNPHKDVEYLLSISCDPSVYEALEGYKISRVFAVCGVGRPSDASIVQVLFPYEDIAYVGGGTMAGLRAMALANVMGYMRVEFYGFDSCYFEIDEDGKPIYYSYDKKRAENIMEAQTDDGRKYLTSPVFSSQAQQFIQWKHRFGWIDFVIYGDSLTKAINDIQDEKNRPKHDLLITDYHREINSELHARKPRKAYGDDDPKATFAVSGKQHVGIASTIAAQVLKTSDNGKVTMLDYGCGKRTLEENMPPITGLEFHNYDPCIEDCNQKPEPADIVICTDVLEHVEPECLENVLDDLKRVTKKLAFVGIATIPALKTFSDGQNTHKTVQDHEWWVPKLRRRFHIIEVKVKKDIFECILQARDMR